MYPRLEYTETITQESPSSYWKYLFRENITAKQTVLISSILNAQKVQFSCCTARFHRKISSARSMLDITILRSSLDSLSNLISFDGYFF